MKLHELVLENWQRHGQNKAVLFDDGSRKSHVTYQDMIDISDKILTCFTDHICQNEVIGLCVQPDQYRYLPAILLSVLQCGAAFYNIDADSVDFACQVLAELGVRFLVLHRDTSKKIIRKLGHKRTCTEVPIPSLDAYVMYKLEEAPVRTHRHDLAYCITTSGTTGVPKIVRVPHACIVPNITHLREIFTLTHTDTVLLSSPLTFDPSLVEIFVTLTSGACLLVVPDRVKMTPDLLMRVIHDRNKVTVMQITPALLQRFPASILPDTLLGKNSPLRVMALGGEKFPPLSTLKRLKDPENRTRLFNLYGTTEVSSWATCYEVKSGDMECESDVPIGNCLRDTVVEVRNLEGPVEAEGVGQLYIGGSCRQCILSPEEDECYNPNRVLMRDTGDLVERRSNGQMYYQGRADRQMKRHGKRINLEEIKSVASAVCNIHSCEAIMVSSKLVLFVVLNSDSKTATAIGLGVQTADPGTVDGKDPSAASVVAVLNNDSQTSLATRVPTSDLDAAGGGDPSSAAVGAEFLEETAVSTRVPVPTSDLDAAGGQDLFQASVGADVSEGIKSQMGRRLPSHSIPDDVIVVDNLPMTKHGKVDLKKLEAVFTEICKLQHSQTSPVEVLTLKWKELLGVSSPISCDANFLSMGGNSLKALHLFNEIEHVLDRKIPELLDIILQKTFNDVREFIYKQSDHVLSKSDTNYMNQDVDSSKFNAKTVLNSNNIKQQVDGYKMYPETDKTINENVNTDISNEIVMQHQNVSNEQTEVFNDQVKSISFKRKLSDCIPEIDSQKVPKYIPVTRYRMSVSRGSKVVNMMDNTVSDVDNVSNVSNDVKAEISSSHFTPGTPGLQLRELWKYDTGKCVDASPLLAISSDPGRNMVFIGSHSHVMSALLLSTGELVWEVTLPDRVESSACLSLCGRFVIVGCYDGKVYCLEADSGAIWWSHDTGSEVKSSPAVDRVTGLVYVGSHSQALYCLDVQECSVRWEANLKAGSIFSSPTVWYDPHCVCVGTLGGKVFALNAVSGAVMWRSNLGRPVFASVAVCHSGLCVGCTDNTLYFLNHAGQKMWSYRTDGPIFSSPVIVSLLNPPVRGSVSTVDTQEAKATPRELIVFGCHDNHVYCISSADGELLWKCATNSSVYSTPFVTTITLKQSGSEAKDCCSNMTAKVSKDGVFNKCTVSEYTSSCSDRDAENTDPALDQKLPVVIFASSKGTLYIVHANTGSVLVTQELPHEVFSSAVVYDNTVIVGCRDNYVYTFKLS